MSFLGIGSAVAFGAGGKAGAITGSALAGAEGIVGAAAGGRSKGAEKSPSQNKKGEAVAAIGGLLQNIAQMVAGGGGVGGGGGAGAGAGAGGGLEASLRQLSQLGRSNPDALRSALAANPQATESLSAALGG